MKRVCLFNARYVRINLQILSRLNVVIISVSHVHSNSMHKVVNVLPVEKILMVFLMKLRNCKIDREKDRVNSKSKKKKIRKKGARMKKKRYIMNIRRGMKKVKKININHKLVGSYHEHK